MLSDSSPIAKVVMRYLIDQQLATPPCTLCPDTQFGARTLTLLNIKIFASVPGQLYTCRGWANARVNVPIHILMRIENYKHMFVIADNINIINNITYNNG